MRAPVTPGDRRDRPIIEVQDSGPTAPPRTARGQPRMSSGSDEEAQPPPETRAKMSDESSSSDEDGRPAHFMLLPAEEKRKILAAEKKRRADASSSAGGGAEVRSSEGLSASAMLSILPDELVLYVISELGRTCLQEWPRGERASLGCFSRTGWSLHRMCRRELKFYRLAMLNMRCQFPGLPPLRTVPGGFLSARRRVRGHRAIRSGCVSVNIVGLSSAPQRLSFNCFAQQDSRCLTFSVCLRHCAGSCASAMCGNIRHCECPDEALRRPRAPAEIVDFSDWDRLVLYLKESGDLWSHLMGPRFHLRLLTGDRVVGPIVDQESLKVAHEAIVCHVERAYRTTGERPRQTFIVEAHGLQPDDDDDDGIDVDNPYWPDGTSTPTPCS